MPHTEPVLPIGVPIAPTQPEDSNPTHIAEYGRGGLMSVATTTARDAIPSGRKKVGMMVFVQADGKYYTLTATPSTWTELSASASISDGDKGDIVVSSTGATWTIDSGVVGTSKLGGDITTAGKAILDDADSSAQRTTLGLGSMSVQNSNAISVTGGSLSGVTATTGSYSSNVNEAQLHIVRKASSGTITKGQVVRVVGSTGSHLTVELADASAEGTAKTTIGIAAETITNSADGYMMTSGEMTGLSNVPSTSFADGDQLWLSETTGAFTNVRPTQPAHGVVVGWVITASNGSNARIFVKVDNGQELDEIHDVLITSVADNDVIQWDGATSLWKNRSLSSAGIAPTSHTHTASQISDSTTAGRALLTGADAAAQRTSLGLGTAALSATGDFAAASHTHALSSLTQSGATSGQVPTWNGTAWAASTPSGSGTVTSVGSGTGLTGGPITGSGSLSVDFATSGTSSSTKAVRADDSRLSDARTPSAHKSTHATGGSDALTASDIGAAATSHAHGNITSAGAIGSTASLPIITTTSGVLTTGSFSTTSGTFCEGSDSRLSDLRRPVDADYGDITVSGSGTVMTINGGIHQFPKYAPFTGTQYSAIIVGTAGTSLSTTASRIYLTPWVAPADFTISALNGYCVTGVASSTAYMAIYASGSDGLPTGSPLASTSTGISCATSLTALSTTVSVAVTENKQYWLAIATGATAPTLRTAAVSSIPALGFSLSAGTAYHALVRAWTAGTWVNFTTNPATSSDLTNLTSVPICAVIK